jgi:biotin carboxyl carrier protein
MKTYSVVLDGAASEVGISALPGGRFRVVIGGATHEVDACLVAPDVLSLIVDHRSRDFTLQPNGAVWELHGRERSHYLMVPDPRKKPGLRAGAGSGGGGPVTVRAAMPGKIVQVEVKEGDLVAAGTGLLIIEAMKMENEIRSEGAGVVRAVRVKPGMAVERDAVLIEIGAADEGGEPR